MPDITLMKNELYGLLQEKGAKLTGTSDLTGIVKGPMRIGISVAVPLPKHIVRDLGTLMTPSVLPIC